jgi:hypothetical protein
MRMKSGTEYSKIEPSKPKKNNDKVRQFNLINFRYPSATASRGGNGICCCGFLDVAFNFKRVKRRNNQHVPFELKVKIDKEF